MEWSVRNSNTMAATPDLKASGGLTSVRAGLERDLRDWWSAQERAYERLLELSKGKDDADLWNSMPTIDSKAVTLTLPIFQKHLGIPLDVRLISPGGYGTIDDLISDLVPKMIGEAARTSGSTGGTK